jgi:hypothetical protein
MVTVHREAGFRVAIYRDDHQPAHVHVIKDGEVVVNLLGAEGRPELRQAYGASRTDIRKALLIVAGQQAMLLAKWQEMHGGTD